MLAGHELHVRGREGGPSPGDVAIGGPAVEGTYFDTHYSPESTDPAVVGFNARFRQRWGITTDTLAALGYDSALLLADGLRRAGTTDSAKLRDALAATQGFHGATGVIAFDEQRNPTKSAVVLTVKDGQFKFVQSINRRSTTQCVLFGARLVQTRGYQDFGKSGRCSWCP